MKRHHPLIFIIPALAMLCMASLCMAPLVYESIFDKREEQTTLVDQYYIIEPESFLESIRYSKIALTPVNERPELGPIERKVTVNWHQADYLYIVNALFENVLGEMLQDWQLRSMRFNLGCPDVQNGFQIGDFGFFRVVKENDRESRLELSMSIDPSNNFIGIWETKYSPNLIDLRIIDFSRFEISADQALQIAEDNGGREKRASVENACGITVHLVVDRRNKWQWRIYYSRQDDLILFFEVLIDPYTGEIRFP